MRRQITYDPQRDYYVILGIDAHAAPDLVRRAYRQAVMVAHPDRHPDRIALATEQLMLLNEAYDVLSSPDLRRRYDQARWMHVPHMPRATSAPPPDRNPFDVFNTRPAWPWWDQASRRAYPTRSPTAVPEPYWLIVADWLKAHRLGLLEPVWMTLVSLWRSPYGGLIALLTTVLGINIAFLLYAMITPGCASDPWTSLSHLLSYPHSTAAFTPTGPAAGGTFTPTVFAVTPDRLWVMCTDPDVQITHPTNTDVVGERFTITGIVHPPGLRQYTVLASYLGITFNRSVLPEQWSILRAPPAALGADDQPVNGGLLTVEPVTLPGPQTGYWVLRLVVTLRDGAQRRPCDVVVLRE